MKFNGRHGLSSGCLHMLSEGEGLLGMPSYVLARKLPSIIVVEVRGDS